MKDKFITVLLWVGLVSCSTTNKLVDIKKLDISLKESESQKLNQKKTFDDWEMFYQNYLEDFNKITKDYKSSVNRNSKLSIIKLSRSYLMEKKYDHSIGVLTNYLKDSDDIDINLELVTTYLEAGNNEDAANVLFYLKSNNIDQFKNHHGIRYKYLLSKVLIIKNQLKEARKILASILLNNPKFELGYLLLSQTFILNESFELAESVILTALDKKLETSRLYNQMGVILLKRNNFENAKMYFKKALILNKNSISTLTNLGILDFKLLNYSSSEKYFLKARNLNINNGFSYFVLAVLYHKMGKFEKAQQNYKLAIKYDRDNPYSRYNYAMLLLTSKNNESEGLKYLFEVTQLSKKNSNIRNMAESNLTRLRGVRIQNR